MGPEECIQCGNVFNIFSNEFTKNSVSCSAMPYCAWNPICQWGPFYIFPLIPYLSLDIPKELFTLGLSISFEVFSKLYFWPSYFPVYIWSHIFYMLCYYPYLENSSVLLGHSSFSSESHPDFLLTMLCFIELLCFLFNLWHTLQLGF